MHKTCAADAELLFSLLSFFDLFDVLVFVVVVFAY